MPAHSKMTDPVLTEKQVDRLFVRLGVTYGHIWWSQFPSDDFLLAAKREWALTLGRFSSKRLAHALKTTKDRYPLPPSLPQFAALCKAKLNRSHEAYRLPALPKCDPSIARAHIARAKATVRAS